MNLETLQKRLMEGCPSQAEDPKRYSARHLAVLEGLSQAGETTDLSVEAMQRIRDGIQTCYNSYILILQHLPRRQTDAENRRNDLNGILALFDALQDIPATLPSEVSAS